MTAEEVESLKNQGNECVRKGNFAEAIIHYTHAVQKDAKNHVLYSNRSLAFLKMQQFYYALEDAKETIKLQPYWAKGYFRKGEVLFAVGNHEAALLSYEQAFKIEPNDKGITEAISKTRREMTKARKENARRPWIWGGGGVLLGVIVVFCDQWLAEKPVLQYLILQVLLVAVFGGLSLLGSYAFKFIHNNDRSSLLEPPLDLFGDSGKTQSEGGSKNADPGQTSEKHAHRRGGAGTGRQRYRMGKS
ncbi:stress-induced-phosphoprotein 1-like [Saccostrea echinata]|uniref:stress-induced-phosphoprotein 1-like n=1 Tax=Saccostrea echinata TaxID=191078 RepID=UPI002A7F3045|nr:stress-induced-phosphoprotein 1-like [Saccostrea echinata]